MKNRTLYLTLLILCLVTAPAGATIGLVEAPHWVADGLCLEITTTQGAAVTVTGGWWAADDFVVLNWEQGDASDVDPNCSESLALRTSGPGEVEVWRVFVPVPCPGADDTSNAARCLRIFEGFQRALMTFSMGKKPPDASGTCFD